MKAGLRAFAVFLSAATVFTAGAADESYWSCFSAAFRPDFPARWPSLKIKRGEPFVPDMTNWPWRIRRAVEGAKIYRLGGGAVGSVYRIHPPSGVSWLFKESRDGATESFLLEMFRTYCGMHPCGIKIPAASYQGAFLDSSGTKMHYLAYPDTRGRTLSSILKDPETPPDLAALLGSSYERVLRSVERVFYTQLPQRQRPTRHLFPSQKDGRLDGLPVLTFGVDPRIHAPFVGLLGGRFPISELPMNRMLPVLIKTDNIIVDPYTLELTLIDPY